MSSRPVSPSVNLPTLAWGIALLVAGIALYQFFSPSPHGYLEIFIAMPVFCLGLATCAVAFLISSFKAPRRPGFWVGYVLLLAAATPLLLLVWLAWR